MDYNFDHQMSLSKSKCWYSNNCLHFLKGAVPLKRCILFLNEAAALGPTWFGLFPFKVFNVGLCHIFNPGPN